MPSIIYYGFIPMALLQRADISAKHNDILRENGPSVFLFFGERFLCRTAADELQQAMLEWKEGTVVPIDGDQEDGALTLAKLMSFSLLPGLQIYRVNDTKLFFSKNIGESVYHKALQAHKANRSERAIKYLADMYHLAAIPGREREPLSEMSSEQWKKLFGIEKPDDLHWTDPLFGQIKELQSAASADLSDKYIESFEKGLPANNYLFLTAENVDKRKKLFTYIKKNGVVVDCSVAKGSGAAAQKMQKSVLQEMMQKTLRFYNKTIEPGALEIFLERVGFHPVAVVTEMEKLALYTGDNPKITLADLDLMVGRSREDALFELTDHFGKKQVTKTMATLHHLLENGVHGLAILATLRNYLRKLLIFRSLQLQPSPHYQRGMGAKQFQDDYLPKLKEKGQWQELLKGHPYALFMGFATASQFQCSTLKSQLELLLSAEYKMKGSGIPERIILENLMVHLFKETKLPLN